MSEFSLTVTDCWSQYFKGDALYRDDTFVVTVNAALPADRRAMLLETVNGTARAVLTPGLAERLRFHRPEGLTALAFREALLDAGLTFHGPDYLFYFSRVDKDRLLHEPIDGHVRRLTEADGSAFAEFQSSASEDDLDAAYVELDHRVVFGAFEQDCLVCAASMYPWEKSHLADLGILTLPDFRGRGYGRRVLRAICANAVEQGYEPQYRCQLDNQASKALAERSRLTLFGTWDVVSSGSTV